MSEPHKHHFVPQFLLRGFADGGGGLVVHPVLEEGSYRSTARNIGHQNDGHTMYRRDGTVDRKSIEER